MATLTRTLQIKGAAGTPSGSLLERQLFVNLSTADLWVGDGDDNLQIGTARLSNNSTPASATANGTAGDICWDTDAIYVCTATNTWKRAPLSTW